MHVAQLDHRIVRKGGSDEVRCRVAAGCAGFNYRPLVCRKPNGLRSVVMVITRLVTLGSFVVTMTLVAAALAAIISR